MARVWQPGDDHQPIDKAATARVPDIRPERVGDNGEPSPRSGANMRLQHGENVMYLWVTELSVDFAIAGRVGQSRVYRDFYARSFSPTAVTIKGIYPNNAEYNRLAAFARGSQKQMVRSGNLIDLDLIYHGREHRNGGLGAPRHRGEHQQVSLTGYIKSVGAGQTWPINAMPFEFEFVVMDVKRFLGLRDTYVRPSSMADFLSLIDKFASEGQIRFENGKKPKKLPKNSRQRPNV